MLRNISESVAAGEHRVVLVAGEAGIGKSRLCEEFVSTLDPAWSTPDGTGPVVEVVEDVHLLGEEVIAALGRTRRAGGLLVLATMRAGVLDAGSPRRRALLALRRRPEVIELTLRGLGRDEVAALVDAVGTDIDPAELRDRTGGNPFFVQELARTDGHDVPWTVREMIGEQLEGLPRTDGRALALLAVAAAPVPVDLLRAVEPRVDLTTLRERSLVQQDQVMVALRHGVIADELRGGLDAASRRDLHRSLADALGSAHRPDQGERWRHLEAAGDLEAARAAALAAADDAAAAGRAGQAITWFERGLDPIGDASADVLARAAAAAGTVGRVELAERWARAADQRFRADDRSGDAERMWSDRSLRYIRRPGARTAGGEPLAGLAERAELAARAGDLETARELAAQILADADQIEDSEAAARAALALFMGGDAPTAVGILERLRNEAFDAGDARLEAWRCGDLAACAAGLGDVGGGIGHERAGLSAMAGLDDDMLVPSLHVGLACLLGISGEITEARAVAADLAAHPSPFTGVLSLVPDMIVAVFEGRPEESLRIATELAPFKDVAGPYLFGIVLIVQAYAHLVTGDEIAATAVLDELDRWIGGVHHQTMPVRLELRTRIATANGDVATLRRTHERAAQLAADPVAGPGLVAARELAAAALELVDSGSPGRAATRYEQAGEHFVRSPNLVSAGFAWCAAAEAWIDDGCPERARALVVRIDDLIVRRGIGILRAPAAAVAERLEAAEVQLTPREAQLMVLLAQGLTNKDMAAAMFLSPKTVRNQLHALFAKLGVSRRAEAAAVAVRLGLTESSHHRDAPTTAAE